MKNILIFKPTIFFCLMSFFLVPLPVVFASGYFPEETFTNSVPMPKAGKIKFREDWVYQSVNGKFSPVGTKKGYEQFDNLGLKTEEANFDRNGKSLIEVTYTYDQYGREDHCVGLKESNNFYTKWNYSYDESTRTLNKFVKNIPNNHQKQVYRFDKHGNVVEEKSFETDGTLKYHYQISYTEFNKALELTEYGANGEVYEKWVFSYNAQKQNIEVNEFDSSAVLLKKYLNTFDENGIQKEVLTLDNKGNQLEKIVSVCQFYK